ncbi:hypothetical protein [Rhodococcus sp. NBC_00297]|uniref:hypothetical protein n=1 Tax=Rhodococcus sp. NBC_00297 TaxID=2976005 RepID=UPI002E2BAD13|nr:hypothetical protein [Rhodococcus sp. NBC_00297]
MLSTLRTDVTVFLAQNIGDVEPIMPSGEFGDKINMLMGWLMMGCIFGSIAAASICSVKLGYDKLTGRGGDATGALGYILVGAVVLGSASGLINGLVL